MLFLSPLLFVAVSTYILLTVSYRCMKCTFTSVGSLALDSDMRDMLSYTKDNLDSPELSSNVAVCKACLPLSRLLQISKLLSVDDLDDVVELISISKRKGNWDLKLEDCKAFLSLRVEFESRKINECLQMEDDYS